MQIYDRLCKGKSFVNTRTSAACILASFMPHQVTSEHKEIPCLVLAVQVRKFNPDFPKIATGTSHQKRKEKKKKDKADGKL